MYVNYSLLILPRAISTLHTPSTLVRHSGLAPSCGAPPKHLARFTSHPRSGSHLAPSSGAPPHTASRLVRHSRLAPSSGAPPSHPIHARPALWSRSLQGSSPQAISTLHDFHSRSSGTRVSLLPAELSPSYPASPGVAAHTAGFFWSVTGAKGGVEHEGVRVRACL